MLKKSVHGRFQHSAKNPLRGLKWLAVAVLLSACAGTPQPAGVNQAEVNRIVGQVLSAQVRIGTDEKLDALEELERFLLATPHKGARAASALEQLAGLYLQIELKTYRQVRDRAQRNGGPLPKLSHDRSLALYKRWLADYPERGAARARIHYQMARAYDDLGEPENQIKSLTALLETGGEAAASYLQEARYRLAELAFEDARFPRAAKGYQAVLDENPGLPIKDYAGYKLTWAHYLAANDPAARDAAVAFIESKRVTRQGVLVLDSTAMPEPDWERVREIMSILARVLYRQGGGAVLEAAVPADRDYLHMIYRRLADVSAQQGDTDQAVAVYEAFVNRFPSAPQAPVFMGYMVDRYTEANRMAEAVAVRVRLVDAFGRDGDWWAAQSATTRHTILPAVRQTTHRLARYYHSVAQESKRQQDYARAADWYRRYLARYPKDREAGPVSFLLGEVLFESGDLATAAEAYGDAAYTFPAHGKAGEAAYAAVYARERYLDRIDAGHPDYPERLAALSDEMIRLVKNHPREPRLPAAFERLSSLLFDAHQYDRLYNLTDIVIRFGPRSRAVHIHAWRALGEAALETGRSKRAEEALAQALEYTRDDPVQSAEIRRLMAAAAVVRVSDPDISAADAAAALARASELLDPSDPLAQTVRVDGVASLFKAGDRERALSVLADFLADYPNSPHRERLARMVMGAGEAVFADGDPQAAGRIWARYRELFGGQWPERDRKLARFQGRAYLDEGDLDHADAAFSRLLATYRTDPADVPVPEVDVDRLAGIRFKRGAALIDAGNPEGLALMTSVADDLPESAVTPAALGAIVTAATADNGLGTPNMALDAARRLLRVYPGTAQADQVSGRMVALLLAADRPGDAAARLLDEADYLDDAAATPKLLRSADLYEQAGSPELAIGAMTTLRDRFEPGSDRWVAAYVDTIHLQEAGWRELSQSGESADPELAERIDDRLLALLTPLKDADQLGPAGRAIGAGIWLKRAQAAREAFSAIALVPPLKENLKEKKTALKKALGLFAKGQRFRSRDHTLNATLQMGRMMAALGNEILASPVPEALNDKAAAIYKKGLKKSARPYLGRAIKLHKKNLKRLRDGVVTPDTRASLAALARLQPKWYDRPAMGGVLIHEP